MWLLCTASIMTSGKPSPSILRFLKPSSIQQLSNFKCFDEYKTAEPHNSLSQSFHSSLLRKTKCSIILTTTLLYFSWAIQKNPSEVITFQYLFVVKSHENVSKLETYPIKSRRMHPNMRTVTSSLLFVFFKFKTLLFDTFFAIHKSRSNHPKLNQPEAWSNGCLYWEHEISQTAYSSSSKTK